MWLAVGRTDMRKGMNGLALQVQQGLGRDPHAGDLYVFRGARGDLLKIVWHDGIGMSLYAKRLERGRFIWPSPTDGVVAISASAPDARATAAASSSRCRRITACASARSVGSGTGVDTRPVLPHHEATRLPQL